jgi:hypothetical protein
MTTAAEQFDAALNEQTHAAAAIHTGILTAAVAGAGTMARKHDLVSERLLPTAIVCAQSVIAGIRKAKPGITDATIAKSLAAPSLAADMVDSVVFLLEKQYAEHKRLARIDAEARAGITRSGYNIGGRVMGTREY